MNASNFYEPDKIIESHTIDNYEILTDDGWHDITHIHKTKEFTRYIITTVQDDVLECANTHILYDKDMELIFAKDVTVGSYIITKRGPTLVKNVVKTQDKENMYDITVNSENHRYYTNNILSHNTNIGKSLILCHFAAAAIKNGKNVLYISAEMSETMIAKRIDSNLLDIEVNKLNKHLDKKEYLSKIKKLYESTKGKLIVKEYPTGGANSNHIRNLLTEIRNKRGFLPELVFIDYLNIFSSSRLNNAASLQTYQYIKAVGEEMRGIAVDFDISIITATQTNRDGASKGTEVDMSSLSDSFGTAMTADWICGIIQTPELFDQNKYLLKNIKSRYDSNINQILTVGVEYPKMRLIDLKESDQEIPIVIKDQLKYQRQKEESQSISDFDFS